MAKNNVWQWDETAANNSDIAGIDVSGATGKVKDGDNVMRTIMSQIITMEGKGADVASAGTLTLGTERYYHVTGTTTITDIDFTDAVDGRWAWLIFDGALTLTHNSTTLKLPGGANITTVAGDRALFVQDSSDNIICLSYVRASGKAVVAEVTLDGTETLTNKTITTPVLTLEQGASVAPTAEGRIAWDNDDDKLKVGTGSGTKTFSPDGTFATLAGYGITDAREKLTANRTYYVRVDGSNSNNGLANTSGGAFLTIQKAVDTIYGLDLSGYVATIQVGDGTYTAGCTLASLPPGATAGDPIVIKGNSSTPGNVIVSVTNGFCIVAQDGAKLFIKDLELRTVTSGSCIHAMRNSQVTFGNLRFGACAGFHIESPDGSRVYNSGNYSIVGGAVGHLHAPGAGGTITITSCTVTLTGTPAWSAWFAGAAVTGAIQFAAVTFSGAATGARYLAHKGAIIDTQGGGASFLPGNSAGSTATGGQYL